jgi:branched-chain amino acid aminotransferase
MERIVAPAIPKKLFFEAIQEVAKANIEDIPEYGTGQSLYLRPFVIGQGMNLGVRPSTDYLFSVFCAPVGVYFKGGLSALEFITTQYDRAAGNGMGKVKFAGNYGASLYPREQAKAAGYAGVIYLDPQTHSKIDEVGAANFFAVTHDNVLVTPKSPTILESITRRSILYLAEHYLGMKVEERECFIDNISEFKEAGACGTAAIITPIKAINHNGVRHQFGEGEVGPTIKKLYDLLIGIYYGDIEAPEGWLQELKLD